MHPILSDFKCQSTLNLKFYNTPYIFVRYVVLELPVSKCIVRHGIEEEVRHP